MLAMHPFPLLPYCNHKHLHKVKIIATWEISNCHLIMMHIWRHINFNCNKISISKKRNFYWWHRFTKATIWSKVCHLLSWFIPRENRQTCFPNCLVGCAFEFKGLTMCNPNPKLECPNSYHQMKIVFSTKLNPTSSRLCTSSWLTILTICLHNFLYILWKHSKDINRCYSNCRWRGKQANSSLVWTSVKLWHIKVNLVRSMWITIWPKWQIQLPFARTKNLFLFKNYARKAAFSSSNNNSQLVWVTISHWCFEFKFIFVSAPSTMSTF